MHCKYCGTKLDGDERFCSKCGKSVSEENLNNISEPLIENKKSQSATHIVKRVFQVIAVTLFIVALFIMASSSDLNMNDSVGAIYNISNLTAIITFVALIANWWQNRKTHKQWFGWRWIIFLLILSVVGIGTVIFSQALTIAREKAVGAIQTDWIVYNAPENNFSVQIPSRPIHDSMSQNVPDGIATSDTYKTADSSASVAYVINVTKFPPKTDLSDSNAILEKSVSLSAEGMTEGKIIDSNITTHNGYPAIIYLIQGKTNSRIKGKNILMGQNLYQLVTAYDVQNEARVEFQKFTESFKID